MATTNRPAATGGLFPLRTNHHPAQPPIHHLQGANK